MNKTRPRNLDSWTIWNLCETCHKQAYNKLSFISFSNNMKTINQFSRCVWSSRDNFNGHHWDHFSFWFEYEWLAGAFASCPGAPARCSVCARIHEANEWRASPCLKLNGHDKGKTIEEPVCWRFGIQVQGEAHVWVAVYGPANTVRTSNFDNGQRNIHNTIRKSTWAVHKL